VDDDGSSSLAEAGSVDHPSSDGDVSSIDAPLFTDAPMASVDSVAEEVAAGDSARPRDGGPVDAPIPSGDAPPSDACAAGTTACGGTCTKVKSDPLNCGACGHSCLGGPCAGGQCQPVQIYSTPDQAGDLAFDSTYVYFIRSKDNIHVLSRIAKDGSGKTDIWQTDIVAPGAELVRSSNSLAWFGQGDVRGCPLPDCAGGPQPLAVEQREAFALFSDNAGARLYWNAQDPNTSTVSWLRRLDLPQPISTSTRGFFGGVADSDYVYISTGGEHGAVRIPVEGGAQVAIGDGTGSPGAVNSTKVFLMHTVPATQSLAVYSVPVTAIGTPRVLVGDYGTQSDLFGGVVADDQYVYWLLYAKEKMTGFDSVFLFKCSVNGCGQSPTVLAQGTNYPSERLWSDGDSLYMAGPAGIFRIAK
jgi:hypothetical protein